MKDEQNLKSIAIKLGVTFLKEYLEIMIYKLSNIEVKKGVLENESTNTFQSRENKWKNGNAFSIVVSDIENNEFEYNIKD